MEDTGYDWSKRVEGRGYDCWTLLEDTGYDWSKMVEGPPGLS